MIGFIGGGKMAEAMVKGLLAKSGTTIVVSDPFEERRRFLENTYGIKTVKDNPALATSVEIIVVAVKPQNMKELALEVKDVDFTGKTIVSIVAGVSISTLKSVFRTDRVIRVMPNTPALVQEGVSVIAVKDGFPDPDLEKAVYLLSTIGKVVKLPEKYMDAVTALSGSGPGFIAYIIGAMAEAGQSLGIPGDVALTLAVETLAGTASLLRTGISPAQLVKMVASPGGTTVAGLKVFDDRELKGIIAETLAAAAKRSSELGG
ncbi:MAG: pyrroline-5-carboxylate reductase [Nitrospirae bacterium]|nr:pyrroline-5-carboxylate reductase [Nitrospirota bacterium]